MHMADALISPAVGGTMWAATASLTAYASRRIRQNLDDRSIPLMGVVGAFIFAAQMINFTIPGTGSSGHLAGGMILAILLGPHASFVTMASVLTVQSLFFADGGLLALGCNIFNLGFFPSYIAYPFIYKKLVRSGDGSGRTFFGAIIASIAALQLGSFCVAVETAASGVSRLPFSSFLLLMQPIHLAIGLIEGAATAILVLFIIRARPETMKLQAENREPRAHRKNVLLILCLAAGITGGLLSWYASEKPDGLEWAIQQITGKTEITGRETPVHSAVEAVQNRTAFLPGYQFKALERDNRTVERAGTSASGVAGGVIIIALVLAAGIAVRIIRKKRRVAGTTPRRGN